MNHRDIKNKMMNIITTTMDLSIMTCAEAIDKLKNQGQLDREEQAELECLKVMKLELHKMKNTTETMSIGINEKIREMVLELVRNYK